MIRASIESISPFFVVCDVERSIAFYCERLGFEVSFREPEENSFFAILRRDGAGIFIKSERGVMPVPNATRHPHLRWDAYLSAADPDALAGEFLVQDVEFSAPLQDTHDGLRGFEIIDPDGYVLFFGRAK